MDNKRSKVDYERTDYKNLAREFGCHLHIGKYGITFLASGLPGMRRKLIKITPLNGWITDPKEIERIVRENGMEL